MSEQTVPTGSFDWPDAAQLRHKTRSGTSSVVPLIRVGDMLSRNERGSIPARSRKAPTSLNKRIDRGFVAENLGSAIATRPHANQTKNGKRGHHSPLAAVVLSVAHPRVVVASDAP
jgi:hypothetical protein